MEYGVNKLKAVLVGVALCLAALLAATTPALAQSGDEDDPVADVQYGDDNSVNAGGDINTQLCQNIVGDINVVAGQYNAGDQIAIGDGNVQAIAQEQNVAPNIVQTCINQINSSLNDDDNDNDNGDDKPATPGDGNGGDDDGNGGDDDDSSGAASREQEVMSGSFVAGKTLANTGGTAPIPESSSSAAHAIATLIPAGALLMVSGITTAVWLGNRRR